jgi:hypothetical protein
MRILILLLKWLLQEDLVILDRAVLHQRSIAVGAIADEFLKNLLIKLRLLKQGDPMDPPQLDR